MHGYEQLNLLKQNHFGFWNNLASDVNIQPSEDKETSVFTNNTYQKITVCIRVLPLEIISQNTFQNDQKWI